MAKTENKTRDEASWAYRNLPENAKDADKETAFEKVIKASGTVDEIKRAMMAAPTEKSLKAAIDHALTKSDFTGKTEEMKWLAKQAPDDETRMKVLAKMGTAP